MEVIRRIPLWEYFATLGGFCIGAAAFCYTLFLNSPNQDSNSLLAGYLAKNNYNGWLNYAIWRTSLIPDCYVFLGVAILFSTFAIFWFPLKNRSIVQKISSNRTGTGCFNIILVALVVLLEIEFLAWAYELGDMLNDAYRPALLILVYDFANAVTLNNLQPGQDYPFFVTILILAGVAALRFRSIWKTLEILSLAVIPLPFYVYIFDDREFFVHFENQFKSFAFVTNFDLMVGAIAVFCFSLLVENRRQVIRIIGTLQIK